MVTNWKVPPEQAMKHYQSNTDDDILMAEMFLQERYRRLGITDFKDMSDEDLQFSAFTHAILAAANAMKDIRDARLLNG